MDKNVDKKAIAGVSIVEIMISLVLVALALIAVTTVFPRINMHRKGIAEAEQAKIIAMEALEFLQSPEYTCDDVESGDGKTDFESKYTETHPIPMGSATYIVKMGSVNCNVSGNAVNTVDVVVEWKKAGKDHNIKVTGALR